MAPWPEPQGTEPKAPDKSSSENNDATRKDFSSMDEEIECNVSEAIELKSMSNSTEEKQVRKDDLSTSCHFSCPRLPSTFCFVF
jgi:hypothetical protein